MKSAMQPVTFAAGDATVSYTPITADTTDEPHGTVTVEVAGGADYDVDATAASATLVVRDDDGPLLEVSVDATVTAREGMPAVFGARAENTDGTLTEAGHLDRLFEFAEVAVTASTADGTATAGSDYTGLTDEALALGTFEAVSGAVRWVGEVSVDTLDDSADEGSEDFTVTLSLPTDTNSGIVLSATAATGTATIADDDPPTVVRVAGTDGEYIAGDVVPVEVTFSSPVDVDTASGMPRLLLETGTTDRHAAYAAGTGTATLRFDYTVQAGDASGDLQYASTSALALNNGMIKAVADALDAVLTLPALNAPESLAGSSRIVVDGVGPVLATAVVTGNTLVLTYDEALGAATPAASAYTVTAGLAGSPATVNLAGSNPVTVSGRTVTLKLATAVAAGATVQVSYTVPQSGSKLQDALGNAAAALTDEAVTNRTMKPTVVIESAGSFPTKDAFAVTITFSEAVTGFEADEVTVDKGAAAASFTSQTADGLHNPGHPGHGLRRAP